MPHDPHVTGHDDPEGEAPWALQLIAHVEKDSPPTRSDMVTASARATLAVLEAGQGPETADLYQPAIDRWLEGRIRKLVRRARGSSWEKLAALEGRRGFEGGAEVLALVPGPVDAVDPQVRRLQVEGLTLADPVTRVSPEPGFAGLVIALTPLHGLPEHPGKAAAQASHAAQVAYMQATTPQRDDWRTAGFPMQIIWPDEVGFAEWAEAAPVQIHDAGFTVVPEGTLTAIGRWS